MTAHLPSFSLRYTHKGQTTGLSVNNGILTKSEMSLTISQMNMSHICEISSSEDKDVILIGSPVVNGSVNRKKAAETFLDSNNLKETALLMNGEFLVIVHDKALQTLTIITDRYSSYPAFYAQNKNEFILSYNYMDLLRECKNWQGFKLRPEKAYEFFMMQRLLGNETHDTITKTIEPATILTLQPDASIFTDRYWIANYKKNNTAGKDKLLGEFVELFTTSVKARSQNQENDIGIFLSGGHDSRLVAAYTSPGATCYTLSFKNNLEVQCAKRIAETAQHNHKFCQLSPDFFQKTVEESTYFSGGFYATDHALFLSSGMSPSPNKNIYLHGHGLDFMYQGMYLHAKPYQLFGRDTYIKSFVPLPENLTEHFIDTIPFRSRYPMTSLFLDGKASTYHEALHANIKAIEQKAKNLSDAPMDQWEYMVFHNPSRHYTFSNVLSKRSCGELRTPSFDNDLYDYYLSLPFEYRLHGDMLRGALYKKNAKIARIPAANHGLPAAWGPYQKTAATMTRKLLKHATFNKYFIPPQGKDRTWPDRDSYFNDHPSYYNQAISALNDQDFKTLVDFIDWDRLDTHKENLLNESFGGVFLIALLSYYSFYKAIYQ